MSPHVLTALIIFLLSVGMIAGTFLLEWSERRYACPTCTSCPDVEYCHQLALGLDL